MKSKNTKNLSFVAIGLVVVLMIAGFNPMFAEIESSCISAKRSSLEPLYLEDSLNVEVTTARTDENGDKFVYELELVTVHVFTVLNGVTIDVEGAKVTFLGGKYHQNDYTNDNGESPFTADYVKGNDDAYPFTITAVKTEDGNSVSGSCDLTVKNRQVQLSLSKTDVTEREAFTINVHNHLGEKIGFLEKSTVHFDCIEYPDFYTKTYAVGRNGLEINAQNLQDGHGVKVRFKVWAEMKNYKDSDETNFEEENINYKPYKPDLVSKPKNAIVGYSQPFQVKAVDGDHNNVQFHIDWGDGTITDWGDSYYSAETATSDHTYEIYGKFEIKVKSRDVPYELESNELTFDVQIYNNPPNKPSKPECDLGEDETGTVGQGYYFTTTATDPDAPVHKLKYEWDWDKDGNVDYTDDNNGDFYTSGSPATTKDPKSFANGVHYVRVRSVDNYGKCGEWSKERRVIIGNQEPDKPNAPEKVDGPISVDGGKGKKYTFDVVTDDVNGDPLAYKFDFDDGAITSWLYGSNGYTPGEHCKQDHVYTKSGWFYVKAKAADLKTDENGNLVRDGNGNPIILSESDWSDSRLIIVFVRKTSAVSDAGMKLKIHLPSNQHDQDTYNMIPKTYDGKVADDYTLITKTTGKHDVMKGDTVIQTDIGTIAEVKQVVKNSLNPDTTDIPGDGGGDGNGDSDGDPDGNSAPNIITYISNQNVDEGGHIEFAVTASDADGDNLWFSADEGQMSTATQQQDSTNYCSFASSGQQESDQQQITYYRSTYTYDAPDDIDSDYTITETISVHDGKGGYDSIYFDITIEESEESNSQPMGYSSLYDGSDITEEEPAKEEKPDEIEPIKVTIRLDGSGTQIIEDEETTEETDDGITEGADNNDLTSINDEESKDDGTFRVSSAISVLERLQTSKTFPILNKIIEILKRLIEDKEQTNKVLTKTGIENGEEIVRDEPTEDNEPAGLLTDALEYTYVWDCGDGKFEQGINPTHTYEIEIPEEYIPFIPDDSNTDISGNSRLSPLGIPTMPNIIDEPVKTPDDNGGIDDTTSNDDESIQAPPGCPITYTVKLYVVYDPDHIIDVNDENFDIQNLDITSEDTTTITIMLFNDQEQQNTEDIDNPILDEPRLPLPDMQDNIKLMAF